MGSLRLFPIFPALRVSLDETAYWESFTSWKTKTVRVDITEDLTEDEREIVKTWLKWAKENNNKEPQDLTTYGILF